MTAVANIAVLKDFCEFIGIEVPKFKIEHGVNGEIVDDISGTIPVRKLQLLASPSLPTWTKNPHHPMIHHWRTLARSSDRQISSYLDLWAYWIAHNGATS